MFPMSDAWKRHSWASGLCSLSHPQKSFPDDKIIFLEPGKSTILHILVFFSYIMTCTPCIFFIDSETLPSWGCCSIFLEQSGHCLLCEFQWKTILTSSGLSFPPKRPTNPNQWVNSCRLWCGYLSLTNSQERVAGVPHVVFNALQSGNKVLIILVVFLKTGV